ncbi:hypothetical protein Y032_0001g436 [Ancylostoma ceylanicum]|uniref:Uncharacterized protein n=1 Tax=Ancylostoma ceylanicum TaxID=53326 RepID=A0A016W5C4_9BILA|nr:hypothetical protein Y032_0001g436 [Ancylostoma ceylanicum]
MSLPSASDSSYHTFTTAPPKQAKDGTNLPTSRTPQLTRLERAKRAIEVMERRLNENKCVRERVNQLEAKLNQINKDMDTAYIKIKDELMRAELGQQQRGPSSSGSASKATSLYNTDYMEKSQVSPSSTMPVPRYIDATLEQRLSSMERSLKRLDSIENSLAKLTSRMVATSTRTPSTQSGAQPDASLYGCHEINEIFTQASVHYWLYKLQWASMAMTFLRHRKARVATASLKYESLQEYKLWGVLDS